LDSSIPSSRTAEIAVPVDSMGLPSGFVPKAPLFVPVIRNVEATRDPSRFSKESRLPHLLPEVVNRVDA
jgi:hypothetical protein